MAVLVEIADAVTAALNGATFSQSFTAVRSYADWDMQLEDAGILQVDVVPVAHEDAALSSRGNIFYDCPVDVGIRKRFKQDVTPGADGRIANSDVDPLVTLLEEFVEFFTKTRFDASTDDAVWQANDIRSTHNRDHLRQMRQYTGIVRLTFEADKEL